MNDNIVDDLLRFRVWYEFAGVYIEDSLKRCVINSDGSIDCEDHGGYKYSDIVVERCVGFCDSCNQLVFQGDVLQRLNKYGGGLFIVRYSYEHAAFILEYFPEGYSRSLEITEIGNQFQVIGNVHQDRDVLDQYRAHCEEEFFRKQEAEKRERKMKENLDKQIKEEENGGKA